jgi:hypothetical protein
MQPGEFELETTLQKQSRPKTLQGDLAMSVGDPQYQAVIRQILRKAAVDEDFRRAALESSIAAFNKFGIAPPDGFTVEFVDNYEKAKKIIVLPDPVAHVEQLTDEDLEEVAGGCVLGSTMP